MTDPHNKKSSSSGPGQHHSELISMYDSHTWPETRRSETFHSQASKLWEFVTEEMVSGLSLCLIYSTPAIPHGSLVPFPLHAPSTPLCIFPLLL